MVRQARFSAAASAALVLAACGSPQAPSFGASAAREWATVRVHVTDASSGSALSAAASGPSVACRPDGADLLCSVPGTDRYEADVSAPGYVTMPVWIGVATAGWAPVATRVAVVLSAGTGRFTWDRCPPCPLGAVEVEVVDATDGTDVANATGTAGGGVGYSCGSGGGGGPLLCAAGGVGPIPIDLSAPGYAPTQVSVPVASFGNEACCWGGTRVTVPLRRE